MAAETLVMKFGGTSVGTAEAMRQSVAIVRRERDNWPRLVVVTSALAGVTNQLLESANRAAAGDAERYQQTARQLRSDHHAIAAALLPNPLQVNAVEAEMAPLLNEFSNLCHAIYVLGEATPRALDAVAGLGERICVRLLAGVLNAEGVEARPVEATQLIVTDDCFQAAHPDLAATALRTHQKLEPLLDQGIVPVVTGFIAATQAGVLTTLGRGGSDYSAALLAAALRADEMWDWTDVDGVMTADPRLVKPARTITTLSYQEIAELAYYGAKVLHPKSIRPVIEAGISLRVCNTFNPGHPGTRIVAAASPEEHGKIKAVTAIQHQALITLEGRGMLGVPGVAARTFAAVAAAGISVPLITQASSEQSICFAVPIEAAGKVLAGLEEAFALELQRCDIDRVWASRETTIVTVVGSGMIHTPGIAGRIFSALGDRRVNVIAIAQGSTEVSISLVVDTADTQVALLAIHELIV